MKKTILILAFFALLFTAAADCRKDTVYTSTIENSIAYPQKRFINQYNSGNYIVVSIEQDWNTSTKKYDNYRRTNTTYNSFNDKTEVLNESWSSNAWVNSQRYVYTYNSNRKITENFTYGWDNVAKKWKDKSKFIATFFGNSSKSSLSYDWNYYGNNTWDLRYKDSTEFDANQNKITGLRYYWDNTINKWEPMAQYKYVYNSHNDVIKETELDWFQNKWDSAFRKTYSYNTNYQIIQELLEKWDGTFGLFVDSRTTNTYNSNNDIIQSLEEDWNPTDMVWENYEKSTYTYSGKSNLISKSDFIGWDKTSNKFTLESREDYKCTDLLNQVDVQTFAFQVYPNPAHSGFIKIFSPAISSLELMDISGKTVQTAQIIMGENEIVFNSNLKNGIYLIKIGNRIQKIVLDK